MPFATANVVAAADIALVGLRVYVRPWTNPTTKATGTWTDLGYVENPSNTDNKTTNDIQSARTGKLLTVKSIITAESKVVTFDTMSLTKETLEVFTGQTSGTTAIGSTVGASTTAKKCEIIMISSNAEAGGPSLGRYIPAADVKGSTLAGLDGSTPAKLTIEATSVADELYSTPATLNAGVPLAPLGFFTRILTGQETAWLNVLSP